MFCFIKLKFFFNLKHYCYSLYFTFYFIWLFYKGFCCVVALIHKALVEFILEIVKTNPFAKKIEHNKS